MNDPKELSHEAQNKPQEGQIGTRHQKEIRRLLENMRRARNGSPESEVAAPEDPGLPVQNSSVEEYPPPLPQAADMTPEVLPYIVDVPTESDLTGLQPVVPGAGQWQNVSPEEDAVTPVDTARTPASPPAAGAAPQGVPANEAALRTQPPVQPQNTERPAGPVPTESGRTAAEPPSLRQAPVETEVVVQEQRTQVQRKNTQPQAPVSRGNFFSGTPAKEVRQARSGAVSRAPAQDAASSGAPALEATAVRPARPKAPPRLEAPVQRPARQVEPQVAPSAVRTGSAANSETPAVARPAILPAPGEAQAETSRGPFSQRTGSRPAETVQTRSDVLLNRSGQAKPSPVNPGASGQQPNSRELSAPSAAKPSFGKLVTPRPAARTAAAGLQAEPASPVAAGSLREPQGEPGAFRNPAPQRQGLKNQTQPDAQTSPTEPPTKPAAPVTASAHPEELQQAGSFTRPARPQPLRPDATGNSNTPQVGNQTRRVPDNQMKVQQPQERPAERALRQPVTETGQPFDQQAGQPDMYQEERSQAQPRQRQPQPTPQRGVEVLHGGIKWADAGESTFEEKSAKFAEAYRAARSKVLSSVPAAPTRTEPAPEEVSEDVAQAGQEAAGSESVNAMYEALARYRQSLNRNAEGQGQQAMPSAENSGQDDFSYQDSGYEEPQEPAYPGHPQEIQGREAHQGVPAEAYPQPSAQQAPAQQTVVQQQYAQEYYAQAQAAAQNFTPPPAAPTAEPPHHVEHAGMHAPQVAPEAHAPYDYGARQAAPGNRMEQNSEAAGVGQPAPQPEAQGYAQYQEQAYANQAEPTGESAYYGGFQQRAQQAEEAPQIRNEAVRERPEPAREPAAASRFSEPARQPVEQAYERAAEPERAVYQQQFEPVPQEQGGGTRQTAPEAVSADDKKSWKAGKLLSKIAKPSEQFETMEARPQAGKHAQAQPPLTPPAFPSETAAPYAGGSWVWQPGGADGGRSWIRRHPILFTGFILLALALAYNVGRYMSDSTPSGPKIAVVNLEGMILDSGKIVEWVEQVRKDDSYKGAVLRINSPGGAVGPSQEIFAAIRRLDQIKPVVASLGGVAASGGYYAALGAREIYSGPSTLTAGIGVKMQIPNVNGLMQTVGISEKTLSTGNLKDAGSAWRTMSPEEESYFYELLNDMYVEFMQTVSEQRKISMEDVQVLADGGAMTGRQALGAKLVDHLGDQHDALERLKVLCNMKPGDSFSLVEGPEQPSRKLKDFFLSLFEAGLEHKAAAEQPRFIY